MGKPDFMLLSLSGLGQKWREFKIKARRNSWAVEHRNQFPVPPAESDEEDEDTSWLLNIFVNMKTQLTTQPWMNLQSGARRSETMDKKSSRICVIWISITHKPWSFGFYIQRNQTIHFTKQYLTKCCSVYFVRHKDLFFQRWYKWTTQFWTVQTARHPIAHLPIWQKMFNYLYLPRRIA